MITKKLAAILVGGVLTCMQVSAQSAAELEQNRVKLPNGWSLTPVGKNIPLGDLPLNLVVSHDKKFLAVTNNGQSTQTIELIDRKAGIRLDSIIIPKSWYGLAFSRNNQFLYASGGHDNQVKKYRISNNKLQLVDSLCWVNPGLTVLE